MPYPWSRFEVGTPCVGFAAALGSSIFTLGAAVGHLSQMVTAHIFAPGNAGIILWTDIVIPLFGFALLRLRCRGASSRAVSDAA